MHSDSDSVKDSNSDNWYDHHYYYDSGQQFTDIPVDIMSLDCFNSQLENLPSILVNLIHLDCYNSPKLKVPIYRKLTWLDCNNCPNFQKIGINDLYNYKKFIKWYDKILLLKKYYNFFIINDPSRYSLSPVSVNYNIFRILGGQGGLNYTS